MEVESMVGCILYLLILLSILESYGRSKLLFSNAPMFMIPGSTDSSNCFILIRTATLLVGQ